jgi:hypothetical protein
MLRLLVLSIALSILFNSVAQEQLRWESYFFADVLPEANLKAYDNHTSIYPHIVNRRTDTKYDSLLSTHQQQFTILPVIDLVAGQTSSRFDIRTGAGFGMEYTPLKGMSMQLGYSGGLANRDVINYTGGVYSTAYFRQSLSNSTTMQFHDVRGRLSYSPNKFFNFQVGIDRNKFGEGDRSLFLDDYGTPYPFALMRMKIWRAEYVILHQLLREPNLTDGYASKHSTSHYLSMNLFKGFNLSFFETVIYSGQAGDQRRGFEWEYMNPFIIYRPVEYGLGSSDKVQIGVQLAYKVNKQVQLYSQVLFDEFLLAELRARNGWWANKFGIQFGIKGNDITGVKGLSYLTEMNLVRPYTYSHGNTGQSSSHQSTMLAHPLGSNFAEWNTRLRYAKDKWDFNADAIYLLRGNDLVDSISMGGDVLQSYNTRPAEHGFYIGNGDKYNILKFQFTVGYTVVPKWRLRAFATVETVWYTSNQTTTFFPGGFIGLRTELWNDRRNY